MGDGYDLRPRFRVEWTDEATIQRVWVSGQVDLAAVDELEAVLNADRRRVEVDLSEVTFMDASGLRCFVDAAATRDIALVATSKAVERILKLTETADQFDIW